MSVESIKTCPPTIQTVLEMMQQSMNEARGLTNEDAMSIAAMMLGFVCMNIADSEHEAHDAFNDTIDDIHLYINANWPRIVEARLTGKRRR